MTTPDDPTPDDPPTDDRPALVTGGHLTRPRRLDYPRRNDGRQDDGADDLRPDRERRDTR